MEVLLLIQSRGTRQSGQIKMQHVTENVKPLEGPKQGYGVFMTAILEGV
jgi:hypothetical protein